MKGIKVGKLHMQFLRVFIEIRTKKFYPPIYWVPLGVFTLSLCDSEANKPPIK